MFNNPTRFIMAEPGDNPLETPIQSKARRGSLWLILGAVLLAGVLCSVIIWTLTKSKPAAAEPIPTNTITTTPTRTHTSTQLPPTATSTKGLSWPTGLPTPGPTQEPPRLITVVVKQNVQVPVPVTQIVERQVPVEVTRIVTNTPGTVTPLATQTPWIIIITQVVVVTPTNTPTPTAVSQQESPTATKTGTPVINTPSPTLITSPSATAPTAAPTK